MRSWLEAHGCRRRSEATTATQLLRPARASGARRPSRASPCQARYAHVGLLPGWASGPTHGALWRPSVRAPRSLAVGWVPTRGRLGLARAPRPASRGRKRAAHMRIACMPHARSPFTRESLVTVEGPLGSHWGPPPSVPPGGITRQHLVLHANGTSC